MSLNPLSRTFAAVSVALEALQQGRRELLEATRFFGMDAPADVEMLIDLQAGWAKTQLDALNALRGRTHALCEVLTERQRHKANRLLQSLSMVA